MRASKSFKLALFSGTAFVFAASAGAAPAQTLPAAASTAAAAQPAQPAQPDAAPASDANTGPDIVVTGTHVVRDGYRSPTPLTVLTREDIQNSSPTNNIADFVNELPSLAGSTRPSNSRLNLSSGQAGVNALNMRNLGEVRTLVLLDGRRSVASTITGLIDINTLPQMLIQRVDVVTGGVSATYGSDGVAGVVNFILDNHFHGLTIQGDSGITRYGDGFNYSGGVAGGWNFGGGRGHFMVQGEIAHHDGVFESSERAWNQTGYVRIQDPNWVANVSTTPRFIASLTQIGAANSTPGGLITGSAGGTANRLRGIYFVGGGAQAQYQYGALTFPSPTGTAAPTLTQGGSWQVNDSGRRIGLDPQDDRYGFFGRVSWEFSDAFQIFAQASYNRQHILFNAGPNLSTGITIKPDNAYLLQQLTPAQLAGITSVTLATTASDLPFREADNRRAVQRYLVGAQGDFNMFGNSAHWDAYAQYGRAQLREQLRNIMNTARMNNATDAVFSIAGNRSSPIVCRINADADPNNNDPACVPLNRMGIGVASPAAIAYVLGDPYRDETVTEKDGGFNLSFNPFSTWAGTVSMAVGAEYREERIRGFVPTQFQPVVTIAANGARTTANAWSVGNYLPSNGSYNVKEAYLETVVPLGLGLELNGAVRATDYSTSGYVTTWRIGGTWQPIPDFRLRVTRSRDIRAPNLNDLFQAGAANSDSVSNPFFSAAGTKPLNGVVYNTASISYSGLNTGNPNLRPEKADQWDIGGVITPRFLPGFAFSADYFRIDLQGAIDTISAQETINRCFEGTQEYCDAITQDPANATRILIRTQPFNYVRRLVRGIDFDASYRIPLDHLFSGAPGSFTLHGVATRYIENLSDTGIPDNFVLNTVGVNGSQGATPTWIFRVSAAYDSPEGSITLVGRGVSSGRYTANALVCSTNCPIGRTNAELTQLPTYDVNHVHGALYFDLNVTKNFDAMGRGDGQFFINVTNLFDADPILVPETGLAANTTYSDLLGRQFRVGVRIRLR
jgi:iron complex outermembrane receptor protein